ncbi:MAG: trypsin-like peptidase domain-containing protein [Polyangiaceae bacterium]|nr:trypsin-like peptidase domain-containing protein [Polyangiaceae bacterium]
MTTREAAPVALPNVNPDIWLAQVESAFGTHHLVDAIQHRKAIVFTDVAAAKQANAEVDETAAQRAVDAIRAIQEMAREGRVPSASDLPNPEDLKALEKCIRFMRPAVLVQNDKLDAAAFLDWPADLKKAVESLLPGVGSIAYKSPPGAWGGAPSRIGMATCFLVADRVVATNIHVMDQIHDAGRKVHDMVVRFDLEHNMTERAKPIAVKGELARHPDRTRDLVLLELAESGPMGALPLDWTSTPSETSAIVAIGHPLKDSRSPSWSQLMFENKFGVKRVSPGIVLGTDSDMIFHDASTTGGSSGSAIVDLSTQKVIAIHSSGDFALRNNAVLLSTAKNESTLRSHIPAFQIG